MRRMCVLLAVLVTVALEGMAAVAAQDPSSLAVDAIFADLTKPGSPGCALGIYRNERAHYSTDRVRRWLGVEAVHGREHSSSRKTGQAAAR
jgi:hypothetical protein